MKKLLFALLIGILSVSAVACMGGGGTTEESESLSESFVESVIESNEESEPASEPESEVESEPASEPESEVESEPVSEPESEVESEPEVELVTVTISYKLYYNSEVLTITQSVELGKTATITLPEIPEDTTSDYAFSGWKVVETGEKYGKDVTAITVTANADITIEILYVKQYTGNY